MRGEPFRGKYRKSFETPVPFTPGEPDEIRFDLPDVAHTFRKGHRIVVHVQSSWLPLVDRNPQTFTDIPNAKPSRLREGDAARVPAGRQGESRHLAGHRVIAELQNFRIASPPRAFEAPRW